MPISLNIVGPTIVAAILEDKRPQFHLCKSMAMYFWTNYSGFNGNIVGKIVVMPSWDVYLAYQAVKILATADLILYKTALLVTGRCFKLTNSPCIFERRAMTSPTTLVSKVRHCHWDYRYRNTYLMSARLLGCLRMLPLYDVALDDVERPIWRTQHGSVDILTYKIDEIAWIKRAGYSCCRLIAEKLFFFPYSQVWSTIVFCCCFFFLPVFHQLGKIWCHPSI